jgi:hypothetical protein
MNPAPSARSANVPIHLRVSADRVLRHGFAASTHLNQRKRELLRRVRSVRGIRAVVLEEFAVPPGMTLQAGMMSTRKHP